MSLMVIHGGGLSRDARFSRAWYFASSMARQMEAEGMRDDKFAHSFAVSENVHERRVTHDHVFSHARRSPNLCIACSLTVSPRAQRVLIFLTSVSPVEFSSSLLTN